MWRKLGTTNCCIRDHWWIPNGKILSMDEAFPVEINEKQDRQITVTETMQYEAMSRVIMMMTFRAQFGEL